MAAEDPSKLRWENLDEAARDAYSAYGDSVGWKNFAGQPMPSWVALPQPIKEAWGAAVRRTLTKAYRIIAHDLIEGIKSDVEMHDKMLGGGTGN